jgi:transglutaminase-like putative cysteine protease
MPIFSIRHETRYRYRRPVAFGEHRMMLRPRDDADQTVLSASVETWPPAELSMGEDRFGNGVAVARFAEAATELRVVSKVRIGHRPSTFHETRESPALDVEQVGRRTLEEWANLFPLGVSPLGERGLAAAMTTAIDRGFRRVPRHERGVQTPAETLALGSGTCRDFAVLMIEALRIRGIPSRFVSGYLHLPDEPSERTTGGNTHAWVRAMVDGTPIDFDPSHGTIGNRDLIRVAVVDQPDEAIPLQGTWFGKADDHVGMEVSVKVVAEQGTTA